MSDSGTLLLVSIIIVIVIAAAFLVYRSRERSRATPLLFPAGSTPLPQAPGPAIPLEQKNPQARKSAVKAAADTLAAEVQAGYVRIVAKTKLLQDQIQLLSAIRGSIDPARQLGQENAVKFEQNTKNLDQLADRYIVLYHELRVLMEKEALIRSPDLLLLHRKMEYEKLQQLLSLSKEIQPLLNENEDIVAPFIGYSR